MVKNRLSDNVGGVKFFLSTLRRALVEERHFALVDGFAFSNRRLARNQFSGQELGPTHASLRSQSAIMITTSNSSVKRSGTPQSITRCSTAHHRLFRAVLRANRTSLLAGNPAPLATSSTNEGRVGAPSPLSPSSVPVALPFGSTGCATRVDSER